MGLTLRFCDTLLPLDISNDSLPASVHGHVLDANRLLTFASVLVLGLHV